MIQRKLMIPKSSMIQRKFQCMDFDNPKVFGDTSIYDGHVVIFSSFCLSIQLSIVADHQRVCF